MVVIVHAPNHRRKFAKLQNYLELDAKSAAGGLAWLGDGERWSGRLILWMAQIRTTIPPAMSAKATTAAMAAEKFMTMLRDRGRVAGATGVPCGDSMRYGAR
jgi:hypothetical protein